MAPSTKPHRHNFFEGEGDTHTRTPSHKKQKPQVAQRIGEGRLVG